MEESTIREKVMKKVRNALLYRAEYTGPEVDLKSPIYAESDNPLEIQFAEAFTSVGGKFIFSENEEEFLLAFRAVADTMGWESVFSYEPRIHEWLFTAGIRVDNHEDDFLKMKTGVTFCEALVARLGSILVSSAGNSGRRIYGFAENHVVVAFTSQIQPDVRSALAFMQQKYGKNLPSAMTFITGPSRTADIEKTLVMGAHGPKELFVFLIDDSPRS